MTTKVWADHFSQRPADYSRFRQSYPAALYAWLAGLAPDRRRAWDCATGSGQVARGLAPHFAHVVATDASLEQLAFAEGAVHIDFVASRSDVAALRDGSVDLIALGAALHWFAGEPFFAEARRVARPGALIAAWSYWLMDAGEAITPVMRRFRRDVIDGYWPPGREYVESEYRTLPFPFEEIAAPAFEIRDMWTLDRLIGYVGTWSAVKNMRLATGTDPLPELADELRRVWGDGAARELRWPLHMRVGRVS